MEQEERRLARGFLFSDRGAEMKELNSMDDGAADNLKLEDLISYIAWKSLEQDYVLTRTKVVKMLYFLDVHAWREMGRTVTGVDWYWHYFGPYSSTIVEACDFLARAGTLDIEEIENYYRRKEYRIRSLRPPEARSHGGRFEPVLRRLVERYGPLSPSELADRSYDTEPMRQLVSHGQRGDAIEFRSQRPSPLAVQRTVARYAPLASSTEGKDEGDVGAGLREEVAELQNARAFATARLFGDV